MAVEQGMTVDQDARWLEIKAMSDSIAYRDDPPTSLEAALCGAVWRARTLERDRSELMEELKLLLQEYDESETLRSGSLRADRLIGSIRALLARLEK